MGDVTRILNAIEGGDAAAAETLLPIVYDELRKLAEQRIAREAPGQTLQATALVHEAYLRLVGQNGDDGGLWDGRGHFFVAAAEAMRRILIERARAKGAKKRGGGRRRLKLEHDPLGNEELSGELLDLDDALRKLALEDPLKAQLVSLRFFAGLTMDEAAGVLKMSPATADRNWTFARAWLFDEMSCE